MEVKPLPAWDPREHIGWRNKLGSVKPLACWCRFLVQHSLPLLNDTVSSLIQSITIRILRLITANICLTLTMCGALHGKALYQLCFTNSFPQPWAMSSVIIPIFTDTGKGNLERWENLPTISQMVKLSPSLLILNPKFLTFVYLALNSGLWIIIIIFVSLCLFDRCSWLCVLFWQRAPMALSAGWEWSTSLPGKVLICPVEGVDGKSQKDEPGWQFRHTQEDERLGDWQILGIALSHVFVCFHQSSPRLVVVFPSSAMFLSSFEGKKIIYILELSWEILLLPGLAKHWESYDCHLWWFCR